MISHGVSGKVEIKKKNDVYYAVKSYNPKENYESKQEYLNRVLYEYNTLQKLDHINIIKCFKNHISWFSNLKIYLEFGDDLYFLLKSGKLNPSHIDCYINQLLSGVTYLHLKANLSHRDLKLQNVVITPTGILKIIDFVTASTEFSSGLVGSPNYSAPDQFTKITYNAYKADIWSLAVCWYHLINRKLPWKEARDSDPLFKQFTLGNYHPVKQLSIPETGKKLIDLMLRMTPDERPSVEKVWENEWIKRLEYCNGIKPCGNHK